MRHVNYILCDWYNSLVITATNAHVCSRDCKPGKDVSTTSNVAASLLSLGSASPLRDYHLLILFSSLRSKARLFCLILITDI